MSRQPKVIDAAYLQKCAIRTLEKQRNVLVAKSKPQPNPRPGDGVCPPSAHYRNTATRSRELWQNLIDAAEQNPVVPDIAAQLLDLLKHVPAFPAILSQQLSTLESCSLVVECTSEWLTTNDPECDQPVKTMRHYQTLGIPNPVVYDIQSALQPENDKPIFLLLVLAWSYILCSRWVENLQYTGASVQLLQDEEFNDQNFWDLIQKQQWQAVLTYNNEIYYAPWLLVQSGEMLRYAIVVSINQVAFLTYKPSDQTKWASPAASFALKMLADFCTTDEIYKQSIVALVVAMMMPARASGTPVLIPQYFPLINLKITNFAMCKLFFNEFPSYLDRCITLSCSPEGIDSLLCSVLFDPKVPCNLVGAQMTGIMEALIPLPEDGRVLLMLLSRRSPKLTPLWAAAICTRRVANIFRKSAGGTPPLELPVASWTGVVESFIQVRYCSEVLHANELPRAEEWRHTYLITAERLPPHAPSPPFGKTNKCNLNIDIRKHLSHNHNLLSYRMHWILKTGEKLPAQTSPIELFPADVVLETVSPRLWNEASR